MMQNNLHIQEIEITISKDGKVQVHVRGVPGKTCLDLTRPLELALGEEILSREMTPESLDGLDHPNGLPLQLKQ